MKKINRSAQKSDHVGQSVGFAWDGLWYALKTERNFQIHILITLVVFIAGALFNISVIEWAVVLVLVALMLGLELMNTAIEHMVNWMADGQKSSQARVIKDMAAAACVLTAVIAVVVGLMIFGPKLGTALL